MEGFLQPFPRDGSAEPLITGQVTFQRSLPGAGMPGGVMPADMVRQKAVEFLQTLVNFNFAISSQARH